MGIVKDITRAYGITVNPKTKTAYFVSGGHGGFIGNVSYQGGATGVVLGGLEWPFEIDIDLNMERLVFSTTGVGDGKIQTVSYDGLEIKDVQELGFAPMGVNFGQIPIKQSAEEALVTPIQDTSVYCMNDSSKKPPYYCHCPPLPTSCKTDKDCTTPWYKSFCMNDASKKAPYVCKEELPPTCKVDADCQR